jgi:hypothetical protein
VVGRSHDAAGGDGGARGDQIEARHDRDVTSGSRADRATSYADVDDCTHDGGGTAGCDRAVRDGGGVAEVALRAGGGECS